MTQNTNKLLLQLNQSLVAAGQKCLTGLQVFNFIMVHCDAQNIGLSLVHDQCHSRHHCPHHRDLEGEAALPQDHQRAAQLRCKVFLNNT